MSLLGREYLSVAVAEDPPGPGDVRRPARPRGVVLRRRLTAPVDRAVTRRGAPAVTRRETR